MPWAVICDFCEAPAGLPDGRTAMHISGVPAIPEGWLHVWIGEQLHSERFRGLVCGGDCAVSLMSVWRNHLVAERPEAA